MSHLQLPFVVAASALTVAVGLLTLACGTSESNGGAAKCVDVSLECSPIVSPPTFDALYANIFQPSCATGTGNCHGASAAAGLDMRTPDSAYAGLSARSQPESVGCSVLVQRVESDDRAFRMPPGPTPLSEAQRCAIRQWVANGAAR